MAFTLAELVVKIRADDAQMQTAIPTLQSKLKRLETRMRGISRVARRMFLVIGGVLGLTVKFASDAEETHSKFLAVFKEEADAAKAWGDAHANAVGRARMDMEKYLASMQDTFVPLGFARRESRKLSEQLVQLGIDLASFNNIADDKALRDLQSALVGNHEAIRRYGIIITETSLKQELLNMGIEQNFKNVTIQQKVQARLNIIMRSSTDAQGDAIRTAMSFANQLKRLRGELKDVAAETGRAFIPAILNVITFVQSALGPIGSWIRQNQSLTAGIGLVTLGVLGLLSVLPLLIAGLSVLAAHPVLAAVIALGAAAAATTVYLYAMKRAAVEAFAFRRPLETSKDLERRIDMLHTLRQAAQRERQQWLQIAIAPPAAEVLLKDIRAWTAAIKILQKRLEIVRAAEEAAAKARREAAAATEEAQKKADAASVKALAAAKQEQALAEAQLTLAQKQAKAEADRVAIILRANEAIAAGKTERGRERAMARAGAGRVAPAFTGIAELFKRIQSAILRGREEAEQKRLMKDAIKIERDQLATQKLMLTVMQAITVLPGFTLTP